MSVVVHPLRSSSARVLLVAALAWVPAATASAQSFPGAPPAPERPSVALVGSDAALAVSDGSVIIGDGGATLSEGRVYIHARGPSGDWFESQVLTSPEPSAGDGFGSAVAVDGSTMLVGATKTGAVFIFEREGSDGWIPVGRLESTRVDADAGFGRALAVEGGRAFVSAPDLNGNRGGVVAFERESGQWIERGLLPVEPDEGARLGSAIAIGGGRLFLGAPGSQGTTGDVAVLRWEAESGNWTEGDALPLYGVGEGSEFGSRIATEGARVIVSSPGFGPFGPAVFVYDRDEADTGWIPSSRVMAFDGFPTDEFGRGLAVVDGEIWVGAPEAYGAQGAAYRFIPEGEDGWESSVRLGGDAFGSAEGFGSGVAAAANVAAIGASGEPLTGGSVTIFERNDSGAWAAAATVRSEGEALVAVTGEPLECGSGGRVAQFECDNVELLSFLPISDIGGGSDIRLNDVWGWEDEDEGREYALVGRSDGLSFVDITDPVNPVYVAQMLRTRGSPPATWRDMKVYRNHVFVVADASPGHGMQIFDLTRLRLFEGEPITFEPDLTYREIQSAHNVGVNPETGYAYIVGANGGGETCGGGLHMVDVSDPTNPTFAGCFADPQTGRASTGYTHDVQCVIYRGPDERYRDREICFGANETALSVADVTDKEAPIAVSRAGYPNVGYTHQVWLSEDQRYAFMNDELDVISGLVDRTRTIIWDVTELDDPQVVREYFSSLSASAHNLYIVGDLMYQSNYASGLRIVDISDPEEPFEVGYLDTAPFDAPEPGFVGSWSNYPYFSNGTVAVTSSYEGLFLTRYQPTRPIP